MTAYTKPATNHQLLNACISTMDAVEQATALQGAIRAVIGDPHKREELKLSQIDKIAAVVAHLLTDASEAMANELEGITGKTTTINKE